LNLSACGALPSAPETRVWFRAVEPQFWPSALQTSQSRLTPSRFNAGPLASLPFETLYLAEDPYVALFEAGAVLGSPSQPGGLFPNPRLALVILNVQVQLQRVADLTLVPQQQLLGTNAQELTGDWRGYQQRSPRTSVREPVGIAPTQELGAALYQAPDLEGICTLSARVPYSMILIVFPQKLQTGSSVEFLHPTLGMHAIHGPAPSP
jgi:RES domain-containing protein